MVFTEAVDVACAGIVRQERNVSVPAGCGAGLTRAAITGDFFFTLTYTARFCPAMGGVSGGSSLRSDTVIVLTGDAKPRLSPRRTLWYFLIADIIRLSSPDASSEATGGCYRGLFAACKMRSRLPEAGVHLVHRKTQRLSFLGIGDDKSRLYTVEVRERPRKCRWRRRYHVQGTGRPQHRVDVETNCNTTTGGTAVRRCVRRCSSSGATAMPGWSIRVFPAAGD